MDLSSLTPDKQMKLQYWLDVIRQCRASGLTNQIWCEQHDMQYMYLEAEVSLIGTFVLAMVVKETIVGTTCIL